MKLKINKFILLIGILTFILLIGGCANEDEKQQSSETEQSSTVESNDTESSNSKVSQKLSDVLKIEIADVVSVEIHYRNIKEIRTTKLEGDAATTVCQEILDWDIEQFDKKKFDPITGGDRKYVIKMNDGESYEIVENGSVVINNKDKYLLISRDYNLSIPKDAVWETIKNSI